MAKAQFIIRPQSLSRAAGLASFFLRVQPLGGLGNLMVMAHHDTENDETMVARKRGAKEIFVRVFGYVKRYPGFAVGTMGCAIATTLASLAFPKLTQIVIDDVIGKGR